MDFEGILQFSASTLRVSTPLIFAALAGVVSERSGVVNIALEGWMLLGAFVAASITYFTGSAPSGVLGAAAAGMAFASIYGLSVLRLRSQPIVAGTAMNLLAAGMTPFFCKILFGSTSGTPSLPIDARFQSAPIWGAWVLVLLIAGWLRATPSGLWVRFAGENPEALSAAGIRVGRLRWACVLLSGALAGIGGASLSIFLTSNFSRNMTAGRGFIALAAVIFGKWSPLPVAAACLLFGAMDALQIRLQGVVLWGTEPVPVQFIQILPYALTVLILASAARSYRAPRALSQSPAS